MLKDSIRKLAVALLFSVGTTGAALSATIDFDGVNPPTCSNVSAQNLDTEYQSSGVTFTGGWRILDQCGNFGVNARSGTQFASFNVSYTGQTLGGVFSSLVTNISAYVGHGTSANWTISGFLGGGLVDTTTVSAPGGVYTQLGLTGIYDSFTIASSGPYGVVDDLSFEPITVVPLPASALLLLSGMMGLFAMRRRQSS